MNGKENTGLPKFTQRLKDVRCCDGDRIRLQCEIDAQTKPEVAWEKDGKMLSENSNGIKMEFDGKTVSLTIDHVYPEDEGEYVCIAMNDFGRSRASACIIVDGEFEKSIFF